MTVDMSKLENAISNARAWCGSILDLHGRYLEAIRDSDDDSVEALEEEAREMPLCVEVRTNWYAPGSRELLDLSERHGCAIVALDYRRG